MTIHELESLFSDLDSLNFGGRLIAAGFRAEIRNLDKPGEFEYYTGPEGEMHACRLEDALGIFLFEARLILLDHHDPERLGPNRDPEVELRVTLLHEMVHAKVELDKRLRKNADRHGRRFVKELRRLVRSGEVSLGPQLAFYSLPRLAREIMLGQREAASFNQDIPNHDGRLR